jgi:hypothetical protein
MAVAATACVQPDAPEVAINKVEASLVFGVKPTVEPAPPPVQEAAGVIATELALPELDELDFTLPDNTSPVFSTLPKAKSDCEPAPNTASAEAIVEPFISGDVPVGLYRWQINARVTNPEGVVQQGGRQFEKRFVRKVNKVSDTVYTFEQVQPMPGTDLVAVNTIRVNTAPVSQNVDPGYNQVVTVPSVGEPERGITLDRIDYVDRTGNVVRTFTPPSGVLLLPLPVASGESYKSAAVDPKSGQTIVHEMTVSRRGRIDACGTLIDGWLVEGTQSTTEGGVEGIPESYSYSYIVATQYGGMIINERIAATDADGTLYELEYTLGQLKPDPLPAGA